MTRHVDRMFNLEKFGGTVADVRLIREELDCESEIEALECTVHQAPGVGVATKSSQVPGIMCLIVKVEGNIVLERLVRPAAYVVTARETSDDNKRFGRMLRRVAITNCARAALFAAQMELAQERRRRAAH